MQLSTLNDGLPIVEMVFADGSSNMIYEYGLQQKYWIKYCMLAHNVIVRKTVK